MFFHCERDISVGFDCITHTNAGHESLDTVYSCVSEWDPSNILLLTTKAMTSHDIACYELSAPTRSNIRNGSKAIFQFFSNQFSNYMYSINPDCMVIFKNQYQSFLCEKYVEKSGRNKYFCVVYLWASQYLILIEKQLKGHVHSNYGKIFFLSELSLWAETNISSVVWFMNKLFLRASYFW